MTDGLLLRDVLFYFFKRKRVFVVIFLISLLAGLAVFWLVNRPKYQTTIVFNSPRLTRSEVDSVRYELLENEAWGNIVISSVASKDLTTENFKEGTSLTYHNGKAELHQNFRNAALTREVASVTSAVIVHESNWKIVEQKPVSRVQISFLSILFVSFLVTVLLVLDLAIGDYVYIQKFQNTDLAQLNQLGLVPMRKAPPIFFMTKRLIDIVGGIVGLIPFVLVYLALYVPYKFGDNKGPMLFKQKRYGLHGKFIYIYIYKFRSMRVGAEALLRADPKLWEKYVAGGYKLPEGEDPRITKLGAFIRKTSLDELPQFINVIQGDMSLVGPRPVIAEEIDEYGDKKRYFFAMKPGLTGIWGISVRSNVEYPERADIELSYLEKRNLRFDVYVLYRTVISVVKREGAR